MDTPKTTAFVAAGKVVSPYTTVSCAEILHSVAAASSTTSTSYVEVKSWPFTITENDYRRELKVEADIEGYELLFIKSLGYLQVELVKPDGARDLICSGSKEGNGAQLFSGTKSLDGLAPGDYRIAVMIKSESVLEVSNRIFRVFLTSKRVYQTASVLQATPLDVNFDITRVFLRGSVETPEGTSVSWAFSTDGGTTWMPISINDQRVLSHPARGVLLKAALSGSSTATPCIHWYSLALSGSSNSVREEGLRFTGL